MQLGQQDQARLQDLSNAVEIAEDNLREHVARLKTWHTWQEVGDALGVSRQAAQQRFGAAADRFARELGVMGDNR